MTVVLLTAGPTPACPRGVDPAEFRLAMAEDVYETAAELRLSETALVCCGDPELAARAVGFTWPGTPVFTVGRTDPVPEACGVLAGRGVDQVAFLSADAPDLPPLLVGKLFRALGTAEAAFCPARGGGLAALATRLPPPEWLGSVTLDHPDAVHTLAAARPTVRALAAAPGWHRVRRPEDLAALDPGLEGWETTRALLSASDGR
ncbi:hypothetical protein NI17_023415 [Thermobifida halotolerans]|uniref:Uncharacterized protein n=1 Tax=Thermobifida halotolerans TaxID=483545 RepID=A0A399G2C6_9ACTN|nr:hypothetical protein [Thermobifida halotolerans]UOE22222.1 hypothetical protein NI17_023415 [Thermobifida halotolerans]